MDETVRTRVRIVSLRSAPFARVLAILYGVMGLLYVPAALLLGESDIALPIGVRAPPIFSNTNLHLPAPTSFFSGVLMEIGAAASYAFTGWLTAVVFVACFNLALKYQGGIDASALTRYVLHDDEARRKSA